MAGKKYNSQQIADGLVAGDRRVIEWLYQNVGQTIRQYILKNSGNDEDMKEVFHLCLLGAIRKLNEGGYSEQANMEGYLFGIARNIWLDMLRKKKRKRENETTLTDKENWVKDPTRTAEQKIVQQEEVSLLHRCIKMLSEECRRLFTAHYFKEVSLVEIAEDEGIPAGTIRKRHFDCKRKLRKQMENSLKNGKR